MVFLKMFGEKSSDKLPTFAETIPSNNLYNEPQIREQFWRKGFDLFHHLRQTKVLFLDIYFPLYCNTQRSFMSFPVLKIIPLPNAAKYFYMLVSIIYFESWAEPWDLQFCLVCSYRKKYIILCWLWLWEQEQVWESLCCRLSSLLASTWSHLTQGLSFT